MRLDGLGGSLRRVGVDGRNQARRQAMCGERLARGEARQLGVEGRGAPKLAVQATAPARGDRQRRDERAEEAEVSDAQGGARQARLAQRLRDEARYLGIRLLAVGGGEALDAGLAELARMLGVAAAWLIAERGAVVAVARRDVAFAVAGKMQAARRDSEIGPQAQLLALGIGEHVGARAQLLADYVQEQAGGLDHSGRHEFVARAREHAHQTLRLRGQGLEVLCGFRRHGRPAFRELEYAARSHSTP